jgi:peroxiredoxin
MLKLGDSAPAFGEKGKPPVKTIRGTVISLSSLIAKGPVMLVFLRGFNCPHSRRHLGRLTTDYESFEELGTRIVVFTRHDEERMRKYWEESKFPFGGVSDPAGEIGKLYGQQYKLLKMGLLPAQFVIDRQGKIIFVRYGSSMSDIPDNEDILHVLASVMVHEPHEDEEQ